MALGICLGILAYRSSYAAILDFECNHIPLPPYTVGTRLPFSVYAYSRSRHPQTKRLLQNVDGMVIWDWWQRSDDNEIGKVKEILWLASLQKVNIGWLDSQGEIESPIGDLCKLSNRDRQSDETKFEECQDCQLPFDRNLQGYNLRFNYNHKSRTRLLKTSRSRTTRTCPI